MRLITVDELLDITETDGWIHEQTHRLDQIGTKTLADTKGNIIPVPVYRLTYSITSSLNDIKMVYSGEMSEAYQDPKKDHPTFVAHPLRLTTFFGIAPYHPDNNQLVDTLEIMEAMLPEFHEFELPSLEPELGVVNDYIIDVTDGPCLGFKGKRLARVDSGESREDAKYLARSTELELFETNKGEFIAVSRGRSKVEGEKTLTKAKVCKNHHEVKEYLGYKWLAKELYKRAEISVVTLV